MPDQPKPSKMLSQTLLLTLAGAATASVNLAPVHREAVRREILARQTDEAGASACLDAMMSIATELPPPPAEYGNFIVTQTETDPCSITLPSTLEASMSSYVSVVSSWFSASSDHWSSAMSQCPDLATLTDDIDLPECTGKTDSGNTGSGGSSMTTDSPGSQETGSSSDSDSDSGSSSTGITKGNGPTATTGNGNSNGTITGGNSGPTETGAGHRETAFTGAAIAIAGFLGVVALL